MQDLLDGQEQIVNDGKLPMFLKVLCILTFVGAGLGILGSLFNILMFNSTMASLERSQEILNSSPNPFGNMNGIFEATKKWGMFAYVGGLIGNALCLLGALMMWKLKKTGFYLYTVGEILPLIGSFLLANAMGSSAGGFMAATSIASVAITAIFYIAFIVMYAVNLKHLK